jgi:hypothetical protein
MGGRRAVPEKYRVFISHAGTDTWVARQIEAHITDRGADAFLDVADIAAGDDFEVRIVDELAKSNELVVLLTPAALDRPYIWMEIGAAWGQRKRIIGILYGLTAHDISSREHGPALLKRINLIDINSFDQYLDELSERLQKWMGENEI